MPHSLSSGRRAGTGIIAASFLLAAPALALEPTPEQPTDTPPAVTDAPVQAPTRIIVKFVENAEGRVQNLTAAIQSAETLSEQIGVSLTHVRTLSDGAQLVELAEVEGLTAGIVAQTLEQAVADLNANPDVEYAEPDAIMTIEQAVNDPLFGQQWHYENTAAAISLPQGWDNADGSGAVVAVLDTGHRPHPDLAANLLPGYDFITNVTVANDGNGRDSNPEDPGDWVTNAETWCPNRPRDSSWHGTHVAGTIAAVTNNATGVAGVARGARIVPVRVLGKCGGSLSDIVDAIRWSAGLSVPGAPTNAHPADVINMSLGGGGACGPSYQDAIDDAIAEGVTVVVAAGNSNADASNYRPASCQGVITVAATKDDGGRAYYSNFGSAVEIAAPGGETFQQASRGVLSTLNSGLQGPANDNYAFYQGTSMAAPHVAGVAALLYDLDPNITPATVSTVLQNTAKPFPTVTTRQCSTTNCGAGIVDAGAATAAITPPSSQSASIPWVKILLKN